MLNANDIHSAAMNALCSTTGPVGTRLHRFPMCMGRQEGTASVVGGYTGVASELK